MFKKLLQHLAGPSGASPEAAPLTLGGVPLTRSQELLHCLLAGATGTGKSTAIAELLDCICARGDRALIVDPNGAYAAQFFEPGDVILNVFDKRSPGWSPFAEVRKPYDFDKLARSIVPDAQGPEAAWAFFSQALIAEVMRALVREGRGTTADLVQTLTTQPAEDLARLVAGTAAAGLFDKEAARALASTRFVIASHLKPFEYLKPGDFSLRNWLEASDGSSKRIYITWREDMTASLAPLIACWVDIVCTAVLSLAPDPERRLWLLLDELATIGKVSSLEHALTKGRKHGLCCVAGVQSIAQLERLYGRETATVLRSCFRNFCAFALAKADPDTAETFSRALGEREVDRAVPSQTRGASGASESVSVQRVRERLLLPSELAELPDLTAYLCLAGPEPARRVRFQPCSRPTVVAAITE